MKKITVLVFCLSSLSLYSSNRPSLQDLKRSVLVNRPSEDTDNDTDNETTYNETRALEKKGSKELKKAFRKLAHRGHETDNDCNSREIINK